MVAVVSCGGDEDTIPEVEVPEEEIPEEHVPEEITVADFLGVWKVDTLVKTSDDDVARTRHIVISSKALGEIEIQGLFIVRHDSSQRSIIRYPSLYATQSKGQFQIPNQEFYSETHGGFSVEGVGELTKDEISFKLTIGSRNIKTMDFKAKRFCSTRSACEEIIPKSYLGVFNLSGVRWIRTVNMCDNCPITYAKTSISYQAILVEEFPFGVRLKLNRNNALLVFFRNDSLIIPTQFPFSGSGQSFGGNIVVRDGRIVFKLFDKYRQDTLYDTLTSQ